MAGAITFDVEFEEPGKYRLFLQFQTRGRVHAVAFTEKASPDPAIGFSRAVRVDGHVFVAATAAIWPDGSVGVNVGAQARRCLQIIERALLESGASLEDVVRTRVFPVHRGDAEAVAAVHGEVFGAIRPAAASSSSRGSSTRAGGWRSRRTPSWGPFDSQRHGG